MQEVRFSARISSNATALFPSTRVSRRVSRVLDFRMPEKDYDQFSVVIVVPSS